MQLDNTTLITSIEELATILKPWNEQLVIGGGVALVLYDTLLSKAYSGAIGTTDIDFLIPRNFIKPGDEKISKILLNNGFEVKSKSLTVPAVQSFIKQIEDIEIEIEFLTDNKSRGKENVVEIKNAGITAQALSYIEMSLKEAMPLELLNQEHILIVKPEAWVFHKGLTFPKRTAGLKKYKDLYGIWFVLTQLKDISIAVKKSLPKLMSKMHESWTHTFQSNLESWIEQATPQDWDFLSKQDPEGRLSQNEFKKIIKF